MRNLKKILALVLALMMVLSVMVFASAANYDDYSDKDQVSPEYAEAVEVLTGMDIFWGSENSFYPKSNVSRAEVATLLYRVMTTDVSGSQVGIYKDYGMFDDVLETNWFAGYVNYAANGELVKGVGDNKYNPQGNVTGYEWITMLLRAIGYDANGEISGSTWKITAASQAKESGILGSFNEATLNSALTREQVAYLLFNAIQARKVNYTAAFGYRPSSLGYTIAWDMFRLAQSDELTVDNWGRPGYVWFGETASRANPGSASYNELTDTTYATIEYTPVYDFHTPEAECDVVEALGRSTDVTVASLTVNGNDAVNLNTYFNGNDEINALATNRTVGEQGRLVEIYRTNAGYEVVMIDQFLAQVTDVTEVEYDRNDHISEYAELTLAVYDKSFGDGITSVTLSSATDWEYSEGDMLLVYAETLTAASNTIDDRSAYQCVKILDYADAMNGAQTAYTTKDSHIVEDEEYPDAYQFNHDEAGNEVIDHTWFFDTYGNLIGAFDLSTTYNFGTITEIVWEDSVGLDDGYALALITYMDGTQSEERVYSIDNQTLTGVEGTGSNYTGRLVSSTKQYNDGEYANKALYRISSGRNGLVLEEMYNLGGAASVTTGVPDLYVSRGFYATNNTLFLVWNGQDYETYTGIRNVPSYQSGDATGKGRPFWAAEVAVGTDLVAEYVFINNATPTTATTQNTFYANSGDKLIVTSHVDGGIRYYEITGGYVNGIEGTVSILAGGETTYRGNTTVMKFLDTQGTLLAFDQTDGYVDETPNPVHIVTTAEDATDNDEFAVNAGHAMNATLNGDVLRGNGETYDVSEATVISYDSRDLEKHLKDDTGVLYVIYTTDNNTSTGTGKTAQYVIITDSAWVSVAGGHVTDRWSNTNSDMETAGFSGAVLSLGDTFQITLTRQDAAESFGNVEHVLNLDNGQSASAYGDGTTNNTVTFTFEVTQTTLADPTPSIVDCAAG